jgi:signal transduction histidine kinase
MLNEFIGLYREEIIKRCRVKVASRSIPAPSEAEIDHGVPLFLNQVIAALNGSGNLRRDSGISESAVLHGRYLLSQGFTVSQVVHDYGDVCQSITDLAIELNAPISTDEFRTLNRCLDDAIAGAVTEFGRGRNQSTLDGELARGTERLGFFAHELRNLMNTAILAFDVLKRGDVGVAGSTGKVLQRNLLGARDLIARSLAEARLTQGIQNVERIVVSRLIRELTSTQMLEAQSRGIEFTIAPIDDALVIEGDRQVLESVIGNLLQNAFKFTKPRTAVTLRAVAVDDRVHIEIEDQCGGLPRSGGIDGDQLFRPFEQRSVDRSGLGLGLAFSRWGIEANNGLLYARNLPDKGCVFTVDLPRAVSDIQTPPAVRTDVRGN